MSRLGTLASGANRESHALGFRSLAEAYRAGTATPVALTRDLLTRIEQVNPDINCFITVLGESALEEARQSEARFKTGSPQGPLDGVPIAIKDLFYIKGVRCTAGSKILANNVAQYDSPVVTKLRQSGAVLIGTTNLHEFACGTTSDNPHHGPVRNPWNTARDAGGSSGGSAAAVASGLAAGAIGTDTGGSVRIPASLCGVLGLKPTYGRVSRLGVIPLASSFDTVGTLNACAWDAAALLKAIAGHEPTDVTTTDVTVPDYLADLRASFSSARVGVPRKYFHDFLDPGVSVVFDGFVDRLRQIGCKVEDVELDGIEDAYSLWVPVRRAEATAFHLRWLDTVPELYAPDVRRLLELGREVSAVEYVTATNARPTLMQRFSNSIQDFDAVVVPTTCIPAPKLNVTKVVAGGKEMDTYSALNRLCLPFNVVGFPALSVPAGQAGRLPVGVQLVGKLFDESNLLRIASAYEAEFGAPLSPYLPHSLN